MTHLKLFVYIILMVCPICLSADIPGKPDVAILISCAYSNDEELQMMALDSLIGKYRKEGNISKEIIQIPVDLAQKGTLSKNYENGIVVNTGIEVRLKAIKILGEIGGQTALDGLTEVLLTSKDSITIIETVNAASHITAENYDYFLSVLGSKMKTQHSLYKNNAFAFASLNTINSITQKAGNILTSEILGIMMIYSEGEYLHKVRDYSRELLRIILKDR